MFPANMDFIRAFCAGCSHTAKCPHCICFGLAREENQQCCALAQAMLNPVICYCQAKIPQS